MLSLALCLNLLLWKINLDNSFCSKCCGRRSRFFART